MNITSAIAEYEKMVNKKLSPKVIRILELLDTTGKQFESMGRDDATHGRPAVSGDVFCSWAKGIFGDDPEMVEVMSDLMQGCYMVGYEEVHNV